jgi:sialate O-acetylesterase
VQFACPFVDHMVLQRGKPLRIWGTASANLKLKVHLADQQVDATTDAAGQWNVLLKPMPAGGPFDLIVESNAGKATVHDVLIGEVWLCSGQSNMQFSLAECDDGVAVAAVAHPKFRLGTVGRAWTKTPQTSAKIDWAPATPTNALHFSAVAYTFAHELENDPAMKDVPIGLLEDCLGGTVIESWLPESALTGYDPKDLQSSMFGIGPTLLYNGMIAPLGRSSFAGVLWYQGEGNAGQPERYATLLPLLFKTWREQFDDPALPMLVVQLPDYATDRGGVYWQWMREAQAKAVASTPRAALSVSINTNDGWDLHPQGKHEIGRRLALLARQDVYKEKVVGHGPVFKSSRVEGEKLIVVFDTDGDQLTASTGTGTRTGPVNGFMLAGKDGVYYAAAATIDGDSITLTSSQVPEPLTVRYAWAGVPRSNLTNSSSIPAAPFRTDDQPISRGHGEAQRHADGYFFNGKDYQVTVSSQGVITSLIVQNQQLLSNAPSPWGGALVANRTLSHLQLINANRVICSNSETMLTIDFQDTKLVLTLANNHPKEDATYHIALAERVNVSAGDPGRQTLKRRNATADCSGVDRVINYQDIAADDGKVLDTVVSPGKTKVIELSFGP